jgi:hypothetical protein
MLDGSSLRAGFCPSVSGCVAVLEDIHIKTTDIKITFYCLLFSDVSRTGVSLRM